MRKLFFILWIFTLVVETISLQARLAIFGGMGWLTTIKFTTLPEKVGFIAVLALFCAAFCECAVAAGAHFVKTSTGFSTGGATAEDIALMRATVGPDIGVKASGGIRTRNDAVRMIEAGANRIGASASIAIVTVK